jgi:hypothetical protein
MISASKSKVVLIIFRFLSIKHQASDVNAKNEGLLLDTILLERSVTYSLALEVYPAIAGIALCGVAVSVAARAYVSGDGGFRVPVI